LISRLMHLDTLEDHHPEDHLAGQREFAEPSAAGVHPAIKD
jgi:hypothetical protein